MRVAVTGGSGRIGSFVVRELIARGHDVVNLDRTPPKVEAGRFVLTDLTQRDAVRPLLEQVDVVCHLGEIPNVSVGPTPDAVYAHNTRAGAVVMQTAADVGIKRLIYTSSCQVYGFWGGTATKPVALPMDETHPVYPHNAYSLSKVANEGYARILARQNGMSIAAFRFPWVMAEEFGEAMVEKLRPRPAQTDGCATYVHATDVARGYALALERLRPGFEAYHFSAKEILSLWPLQQRLREHHPDFPPLPPNWPAFQSPVITDKLRDHFGWEAMWNFLDFYRARYGEPAIL